jgi:hypothetical protein
MPAILALRVAVAASVGLLLMGKPAGAQNGLAKTQTPLL